MLDRNTEIAARFAKGETRTALAREYGLTPRRISQIAAAHGVHRYDADQVAMGLRFRGGRPRDAALAELADDAALYAKARRYFGAVEARRMLGIAA